MKLKLTSKTGRAALTAALLVFSLASCDGIKEGMTPCPEGVSLRFVYNYNMLYANAFPGNVDCLTVYVYDSEGNYLETHTEQTGALADEAYRMQLDLKPGQYHFVAYGGLACPQASFRTDKEPAAGSSVDDLETYLPEGGGASYRELHGFYFGELDMEVTYNTAKYDEGTVEMMKNTNNIQIMLQHLDNEPVYADDFTFSITDDNTRFDCHNSLIPVGTTTYLPWAKGQRTTGTRADGDANGDYEAEENVVLAYAELSTSRLWTGNSPRLTVTRNDDGENIIEIPLNNYLLLMKSDHYSDMGNQEFLDRESDWSLVFFLDEGDNWYRVYIIVNDWVVRINDITTL